MPPRYDDGILYMSPARQMITEMPDDACLRLILPEPRLRVASQLIRFSGIVTFAAIVAWRAPVRSTLNTRKEATYAFTPRCYVYDERVMSERCAMMRAAMMMKMTHEAAMSGDAARLPR